MDSYYRMAYPTENGLAVAEFEINEEDRECIDQQLQAQNQGWA